MNSKRAANGIPGKKAGPIASKATDWPAVPTVFYYGACTLCRREIAHYRQLRDADRLAWIDISSDQTTLKAHGLSRQEAMERLYVLDAAGHWQIGAWAFAELWSHLPRYHVLASLLRRTGALPLLDRAYTQFARWRVRRRADPSACSPAMTGLPNRCTDADRSGESARPGRLSLTAGEKSCA